MHHHRSFARAFLLALGALTLLVASPLPADAAMKTVNVIDFAYDPDVTAQSLGEVVRFNFPAANFATHTATEDSGLNVFTTGFKSPGTIADFTPTVASTYTFHCQVHASMTGKLKVKMKAKPTSGTTATTFVVTWATAIPPNLVVDVQIQEPGSSDWSFFRRGVTSLKGNFTPAAGAGTYLFRTRLKSGVSTPWSPPLAVTVA